MTKHERWWDHVDWWTDPALAYAKGMADGYAAGRADRDVIDDQVHRAAVRNIIRIVDTVDARRRADRPALRLVKGGAA